jgi:hypothetical protein
VRNDTDWQEEFELDEMSGDETRARVSAFRPDRCQADGPVPRPVGLLIVLNKGSV